MNYFRVVENTLRQKSKLACLRRILVRPETAGKTGGDESAKKILSGAQELVMHLTRKVDSDILPMLAPRLANLAELILRLREKLPCHHLVFLQTVMLTLADLFERRSL